MGFGPLFIGYFISTIAALAFPEIATFTGYAIMTVALLSLAEYEKLFGYTLIATVPVTLISFVLSIGTILGYFGVQTPAFFESLTSYTDPILNALKLVFHVMLCYSILRIAEDTGVTKLCFPAKRNILLYAVCYAADIFASVLAQKAPYLFSIAMLLYLFTIIMNHIMIFSAYMNICDENDVDMEIKKTNVKWFDKIVEKNAELDQKAADETKAYFQNKLDRKAKEKVEANAAKANNSKNKKKKKK